MADTLIVFVKAPVMGRAKTRLAREIGQAAALRLYRSWTARVLREAADARWRTALAVTPDIARYEGHSAWGPRPSRIAQGSGNLGQRMAKAIRCCAPGPVVIVGSDIPGLRRADIAAAFRALRRTDAVFGPAPDGGYWLIGLRRAQHAMALRKPIRWSSEFALADTLDALGPTVTRAFLRVQRDIDTRADLTADAPQTAE